MDPQAYDVLGNIREVVRMISAHFSNQITKIVLDKMILLKSVVSHCILKLRQKPGKMLLASASQAIFDVVPSERRIDGVSPIVRMKAIKNKMEVRGMRAAHLRDGVAVIRYLYWLKCEIDDRYITEIDGAKKLDQFRKYGYGSDCGRTIVGSDSFRLILSIHL